MHNDLILYFAIQAKQALRNFLLRDVLDPSVGFVADEAGDGAHDCFGASEKIYDGQRPMEHECADKSKRQAYEKECAEVYNRAVERVAAGAQHADEQRELNADDGQYQHRKVGYCSRVLQNFLLNVVERENAVAENQHDERDKHAAHRSCDNAFVCVAFCLGELSSDPWIHVILLTVSGNWFADSWI